MKAPIRLTLSRAKGFNLQAVSMAVNGLPAVKVARPSRWGNPYRVGDPIFCPKTLRKVGKLDQLGAVEKFRRKMTPADGVLIFRQLRGHNLACWCALDQPCHADVLLDIANRPICEAVE